MTPSRPIYLKMTVDDIQLSKLKPDKHIVVCTNRLVGAKLSFEIEENIPKIGQKLEVAIKWGREQTYRGIHRH